MSRARTSLHRTCATAASGPSFFDFHVGPRPSDPRWQSFDGVKGGLSGFLQYLEEEIESLNASEKEGFRCCSPEFKPTPKPQNLKNRKPQVLKPRP